MAPPAGSPKALPAPPQGLLLLSLLLAWPGCQADVQVSVPAEMEVLLGEKVSILCTHMLPEDDPLVEWFITAKSGARLRVAYSEHGQWAADKDTEYTDRVSLDSKFSLVINATDVADERDFFCLVTTRTAGSGEGVTRLKVYGPPELPEVKPNPRPLTLVEEFASEIASCISRNGYPVPNITWYKDGFPLNVSTDRNKELYVSSRTVKEASGLLSVESTLFLLLKKADKDSRFHCQVNYWMPRGEIGRNVSESFRITLHYVTENVQFALESPEIIKEGDEVRLRCQGDGYPPSDYIFFKVQADGNHDDLGTSSDGVLLLPSVTKADSGTYRCEVLDFDSPDEVELEKEVTINVNYLNPLVVNSNKTLRKSLGESIELTCSGSGSQRPELSWWKGTEQVVNGGVLVLNSLTFHMAGEYSCQATVPSVPGLQREQTIQVIVQGKPHMERHQSQVTYHKEGQKVMLICSALGHPKPQITWSTPGDVTVTGSDNRITSELVVMVTAKLVQDGITCMATNQNGTIEQTFQLQIAPPTTPPLPGVEVEGKESQSGSMVAVIAVCVCVLLLLLIVGFFYFMQRRGWLPCGRGEKRSLTPKERNPDDTVVEMKSDKRNEQTGLLSPGGGGGGGGGGTNEC